MFVESKKGNPSVSVRRWKTNSNSWVKEKSPVIVRHCNRFSRWLWRVRRGIQVSGSTNIWKIPYVSSYIYNVDDNIKEDLDDTLEKDIKGGDEGMDRIELYSGIRYGEDINNHIVLKTVQ